MTTTEIIKPDKTLAYQILDDGIQKIKNNYENSRETFNRICHDAINKQILEDPKIWAELWSVT